MSTPSPPGRRPRPPLLPPSRRLCPRHRRHPHRCCGSRRAAPSGRRRPSARRCRRRPARPRPRRPSLRVRPRCGRGPPLSAPRRRWQPLRSCRPWRRAAQLPRRGSRHRPSPPPASPARCGSGGTARCRPSPRTSRCTGWPISACCSCSPACSASLCSRSPTCSRACVPWPRPSSLSPSSWRRGCSDVAASASSAPPSNCSAGRSCRSWSSPRSPTGPTCRPISTVRRWSPRWCRPCSSWLPATRWWSGGGPRPCCATSSPPPPGWPSPASAWGSPRRSRRVRRCRTRCRDSGPWRALPWPRRSGCAGASPMRPPASSRPCDGPPWCRPPPARPSPRS